MECNIKYNNNITIINDDVKGLKEPLKKNEWFALMVVDDVNWTDKQDNRSWFDKKKGWLGLECTSEIKVYISKTINNRTNRGRGNTQIIKVEYYKLCCELTY